MKVGSVFDSSVSGAVTPQLSNMRKAALTNRLHGVGDQAGRLAVRLGQVVREPLVLRLLGTELHELSLHQVRHDLQQITRRSLRASYVRRCSHCFHIVSVLHSICAH